MTILQKEKKSEQNKAKEKVTTTTKTEPDTKPWKLQLPA